MKRNSITKNYIYNLLYQIFKILMPIITTPYLARTLGAEATGIYSYTLSITTYFILLGSLGIAVYAQREIAYVQEDIRKRSKVFWEIMILRTITLAISTMFFYFICAQDGQYSLYYKVFILEIIATCFDISWFFQGLEVFTKTIMRNIFVKIVSIILTFIFIKSPDDLIVYVIIYVLSTFLGNIALWFNLNKYVEKVSLKSISIKEHIKPVILLFIPQIATQIYSVLDKTMIGNICGNMSEVAYYEQSQKIVKILLTVVTSLGTVMLPRMSKIFAEGKKEEISQYVMKSFRFVFFLAFPMIFGIISITNSFVPIFFGDGYEKVEILMNVMTPIVLFIGVCNVMGAQYLLPTNRQREYTFSVFGGAIANVILNLLLISKFTSIGAAIATVFAEFTVTCIQYHFIRKEINIKKILSKMPNYIIASLIMFAVTMGIRSVMPEGIETIFLQICLGTICYFSELLLLRDSLALEFINKIKVVIEKLKLKIARRSN